LRTHKKPGAFRALLEIYRALPQDAEDNRNILARNGKLKMPVLALAATRALAAALSASNRCAALQRMFAAGL